MSNIPMREVTKVTPSRQSSSPAIRPSWVERVSRRVIRMTMSTTSTPQIAAVNRHPIGV